MTEYRFETHAPVDLYVEFGKGNAQITCTETSESGVLVEGRDADEVLVELRGDQLRVEEPRRVGGLFRDTSLRVTVTVPERSALAVKTGSADVTVSGTAGTAQLRTGSGDTRLERAVGDVLVETGSGDVTLGHVEGRVRSKSGSGDLAVGTVTGDLQASTGSGDTRVDASHGDALVKSGSGDLRVGEAHGGVTFTTGSGDCVVELIDRGKVTVKGASGDVRVGVAAGTPVWTDISTVTGAIRSELEGTGQPAEGQDHVEVRAKTATGDVVLVRA